MNSSDKAERVSLGKVVVPISFGDQVITSLLFNHDSNPVHHKPDHAVQWMLGLLSTSALAGAEEELAEAEAEERCYTLGALLMGQQDVVVMPGIILAALCYERYVQPSEQTISISTTLTYPLLVPTKGSVALEMEASELRSRSGSEPGLGEARHILVEAFGPSLTGRRVRILKLEALAYGADSPPDLLYERIVASEFAELSRRLERRGDLPELHHASAISTEDRRRYGRIVGLERPITPSAWQAKIPRVLTETVEHVRTHQGYQAEVKAYYAGRSDEAQRRAAIRRYVEREVKYGHTARGEVERRVEELAQIPQQLYARQYTVFDPRLFGKDGAAVKPGTPFDLDLTMYELRLRRGVHRFFTGARLGERQVFMGDAMVSGQSLVTELLANFLCEINYSFRTLQLFDYRRAGVGSRGRSDEE